METTAKVILVSNFDSGWYFQFMVRGSDRGSYPQSPLNIYRSR